MLVCALLVHIAHETAGAARIRHSLRPLIFEGESYLQTSGASRREIAKVCLELPSLRGALATTCPPKLDERRRKQSILSLRGEMDCFAEPVIGRAFARPVGSQ
jgi:hypothetical protein